MTSFGEPHHHFERDRLDQPAGQGARRGRRAIGDRRHRRRAVGAGAAAGPRLDGARRGRAALLGDPAPARPHPPDAAAGGAGRGLRGLRVAGRRSSCRIKWPNDIWLDERKLAGVLIEARPPDWAVIGVGVNVSIGEDEFPADLRWPAISLGHGVEVGAAPRRARPGARSAGSTAPAERVLDGVPPSATRCAAARSPGRAVPATVAAAASPTASTSAATCSSATADGEIAVARLRARSACG